MSESDDASTYGKRPDMVVHTTLPFNSEPPLAALVDQPLTDVDTFYTRNHGEIPHLDAEAWRLVIDGLVDHQLTLDLATLKSAYPQRSMAATLQCAGNRRSGLIAVRDIPGEAPWRGGATSTAVWTGVPLAAVVGPLGLAPTARHLCFEAPDVAIRAHPPQPYGSSITVEKAMSPEVLLAWEMNGEPLTPLHGFPVRVVVPGWIGARSVKWVTRITATTESSTNYYQRVAYRMALPDDEPASGFELGPVALNCEILSPAPGSTVVSDHVEVVGYAYAGDDRRVVRVDVSADRGTTWIPAELDAPDGPWTWQHWRLTVPVAPGITELVARAWDSSGALQPSSAADVWNPKGYLNNSWPRVTVVREEAPAPRTL